MPRNAYFYAFLAVLFWSSVATAFKLTLRFIDPFSMLFYASLIASVVLGIACFLSGKCVHLNGRWLSRSAIMGLLNPFLYYIILFNAYDRLPAQMAQAINYTWALVLVILSAILLHQRITLKQFSGVLIGFLGAVVVSSRGRFQTYFHDIDVIGLALAFASAFVWAYYWIMAMRDERDEIVAFFGNFLMGTIYVALLLMFTGIQWHPPGFVGSVWIGLFEMGITFLVWNRALKLAENTAVVANLVYLTPFFSLILIRLVLGETIMPSTVVGLILIIAGIIISRGN